MPSMKTPDLKAGATSEVEPGARSEFPLPVISDRTPSSMDRPMWRSIEEKNGDAALLEARQDEFPKGAGVLNNVDRRSFLQLLGGSLAVAGASACWRPPEEKIFPYTRAPEDVTPGVPRNYASAFTTLGGYATGVVVESYDGRPIKVEGNELHPASGGATGPFEQAEVHRIYDPQRSRQLSRKNVPQGWAGFLTDVSDLTARFQADGGAKLRFLVGPNTSPTVADLRSRIQQKFPKARFYAWSPVSTEASRQGAQTAFGQPLDAQYDLTNAQIILSLDSDFLYWDPDRLRLASQFADKRVPENGMNRLYVAESTLTVTGTNADHRLPVRSADVVNVARALAQALAGTASELAPFGGAQGLSDRAQKWVQAVAQDLANHKGRSVVMAGFRQPAEVHALAHAINAALGNLGQTVRFVQPVTTDVAEGAGSLRQLVEEIKSGAVDTLVIDAWNPAYAAPSDIDFAGALKQVPNSIYFHYYVDETAKLANWLVPAAHDLETWGDSRGPNGTASIVQPLIAPLFNGVAPVSLYAAIAGVGDQPPHDLVKAYWRGQAGGNPVTFEADWQKWLADGVIPATAAQPTEATVNYGAVSQALQAAKPAAGELELNFVPSYALYDGRYSNNAWLQELPDPATKVTWDNPLVVGPKLAKQLGIERGDLVTITVGERTLDAAVFVLPGQADNTATLALGYGREATAEQVARGVGFNSYTLRTSGAPWFVGGATIAKTGRSYPLAVTQDHWAMENEADPSLGRRDIALMAGVAEHEAMLERVHVNRETPLVPIQEPVDYANGYKWGMTIDMSRCISCNACVVACQAENNIPVVGKDQVIRAREMHWIMIDRYFVGYESDDPHDVEVAPQPRMCVHCETAPCEYVCPVNATVHSDEGLNEMVYNRCIGTRYCSNNCPYKVRRFNYLHWNADQTPTQKMRMNPEVTVRARGVMEKCTYCVQRIERVRINTRVQGREIKDGDIKTACQTACPTNTIVFGNLNDKSSRVAKLHADERRYDLLYSLGTRPRTGHLVRIKNYNPALVVTKAGGNAEHH